MNQVKHGDMVKIHYTGKLENGEVFDSSKKHRPLEFEIVGGNVLPSFEKGILGMREGTSKRIIIPHLHRSSLPPAFPLSWEFSIASHPASDFSRPF